MFMPSKSKNNYISFAQSINDSLFLSMKKDKNVILIGLGVDDPKSIFGTTEKSNKNFQSRVFDMPTSENAMTGIALGLAMSGTRPVITHQRVEFALLSMEQIINQISKWHFMSGGIFKSPLVIRLIIGRGWGQGPQHSQSLESLFAHIPGLKVIAPSSPRNAKGLLAACIKDNNPVIFFEHRWLHHTFGNVPKNYYTLPIDKSNKVLNGKHITIISFSFATIEAIKTSKILKKYGIEMEIIDLISLRPLDISKSFKSVLKTKKIIIVENGWVSYGIGSEILSKLTEKISGDFRFKAKRMGLLDVPMSSTRSLANEMYADPYKIGLEVLKMLNIKSRKINSDLIKLKTTDIPDQNFKGPF